MFTLRFNEQLYNYKESYRLINIIYTPTTVEIQINILFLFNLFLKPYKNYFYFKESCNCKATFSERNQS